MIELAITICLFANTHKCRDEALTFSNVSVLTCLVGGQAQIAAYMERRPRWFVARWTCRPAGMIAKA